MRRPQASLVPKVSLMNAASFPALLLCCTHSHLNASSLRSSETLLQESLELIRSGSSNATSFLRRVGETAWDRRQIASDKHGQPHKKTL